MIPAERAHATITTRTGQTTGAWDKAQATRCPACHDPPREVTPSPPPVADVLADIHARHTPSANPSQWVAKLRGTA